MCVYVRVCDKSSQTYGWGYMECRLFAVLVRLRDTDLRSDSVTTTCGSPPPLPLPLLLCGERSREQYYM